MSRQPSKKPADSQKLVVKKRQLRKLEEQHVEKVRGGKAAQESPSIRITTG